MSTVTFDGDVRRPAATQNIAGGADGLSRANDGAPHAQSGSIHVEVHASQGGALPDLSAIWDECLRAAPDRQQLYSYEWFAAWLQTFAHGSDTQGWTGDSRILVARNDAGRVCGILPLARNRQHRLNWWSLGGYYQPLRGFVCLEGTETVVCAAFVRSMLESQKWGELYRFGPLDSAAPECVALLDALRAQGASFFTLNVGRNITIRDLPKSRAEFQQSSRKRSSIKRVYSYERKIQRDGQFEVRQFTNPRDAQLREMLEACRTVELASWMPRLGGNMRFAPKRGFEFWERICNARLSDRNQIDVQVGYFNGAPVAFDFSLWGGGICYMIAGNYDEKYSHYRVGSIVCLHALEAAVERGASFVDLAPGNIEYKGGWGGQKEHMRVEVFVAPSGFIPRMLTKLTAIPRINKFLRSKVGA